MSTENSERVTVVTQYVGQALRVVLEREWLASDNRYRKERETQAELIIEPGTRAVIGKHGLRVEALKEGD